MLTPGGMHHIRHFIWDFDGTLFDTYPTIIADLRSALQEWGGDCDPVLTMQMMLVNIPNARNYYADKYGIDRQALSDAYHRWHDKSTAFLAAQPMDGAREVLEKIRATGGLSYIFTHRSSVETRMYLQKYGLEEYFHDIIGPDTPGFAVKPAPDAVLHLMRKYDMRPNDTVMVGDRDCDLGSGRNAGIGSVHLVCAVAPEALECTWKLSSLRDMLELL
jgi:phosphoglycolate phosphatase-like HAD superfamily hydrolase